MKNKFYFYLAVPIFIFFLLAANLFAAQNVKNDTIAEVKIEKIDIMRDWTPEHGDGRISVEMADTGFIFRAHNTYNWTGGYVITPISSTGMDTLVIIARNISKYTTYFRIELKAENNYLIPRQYISIASSDSDIVIYKNIKNIKEGYLNYLAISNLDGEVNLKNVFLIRTIRTVDKSKSEKNDKKN